MASITKRGKTWQYTVSRYTEGKYDPVLKSGFKTKKEAQLAALDVEMRLQKGANVITRDRSFADYFDYWIEKYKKENHQNTYRRYQDSLRRVQESFKDKPIQKISSDEYQTFLNKYAASRSKESVRKLNTHIRACVRDAIDEGYLAIDFTRKSQLGGSVPSKKESEKYINYEDSKMLYEYLIAHAICTSDYLILLGVVSGLRFGELVGLTETACDFEKSSVYIHQAWDYRNGSGFTSLKNTSSERTIPIDPVVMDKLKRFIIINKEENKDGFSKNAEDGLIFKSVGKLKVVSNNAANKQLHRILKHLGIKEVGCHGLRHTHASVLLHEGFNIQYVSERLGHESIQTTLNVYSHVLRELRAREDENILHLYKQRDDDV